MDRIELIGEGAPSLIAAANGVWAEHLDLLTPCDEFNVRQLCNHIASFWTNAAKVPRNEPLIEYDEGHDFVGDNPAAIIGPLVRDAVSAWREFGEPENLPFGPGIVLFEGVIHGWDLAIATGQWFNVSAAVADEVYNLADVMCIPERRGEGKPFDPEVLVALSASTLDRALVLTGRDPNWQP